MAVGIVSSNVQSSLPPGTKIPNSVYNIVVSFAAALGGFLFGYEIGIVDAVLRMDDFGLKYDIKVLNATTGLIEASPHAADVKGWVTSTFLLGCVVGALIVSWMADSLGRKWSILIGGGLFAVGGGLQAASVDFASMYSGRVVSGFGIGILSMCVPLYISETAPTHIRGRMIAIQQLMITIGIFIASCINAGIFVATSGEFQWRLALAIQCVPGALLLVIMIFMPYSPRWLVNRDRDAEAITVLSKLRASPPSSVVVTCEYTDIKNGVAFERQIGEASWGELGKTGIFNRVLIALALQTFQQLTGINVILYYAGELFGRMGFGDTNTSTIFVIVNSMVNLISTFPGMYLIERMGRKKLLVIGGFVMGIAHFSVCLFVGLSKENTAFAWAAVFSVYVFILFFSSTWGPIVWVYQSEIFPLRIRAKATGIATFANWSWNAVVAKFSPVLFERIDFYTYAIFGGFGILMGIFSLIFVPETMGKRLEDMDELFGYKNSESSEQVEQEASKKV